MEVSLWIWVAFFAFVIVMLALDLGIFNKENTVPTFEKSLMMTGMWVALAFIFAGGIWYFAGSDHALDFVTGYLLEESLSVDNLFILSWSLASLVLRRSTNTAFCSGVCLER